MASPQSEFWRNIADEFRSIPKSWWLSADRIRISGSDTPERWRLTGNAASIGAFDALARRAATKIATSEPSDLLILWLDTLRQDSSVIRTINQPTGETGKPILVATINKVGEVSARYCKKLEADAIQAEFEEQQRNDPKNWPPILAQFEAFKKLKQLTSGPHEQVPEALVRITLAQQLSIRPEEVTAKQINLSVADLLPYYPAITLAPSANQPKQASARMRKKRKSRKIKRSPKDMTRSELLLAYKREGREAGVKITDLMIAKAASQSWNDRTPISRWKRNDPRCTAADDFKIRRVLKTKPHLKK
ncbi:MAG TPA: hypothetical protein VGV68_04460 [Terriglobia bacterium]|nr:hypothetical protein [Terriglobia bacterium]